MTRRSWVVVFAAAVTVVAVGTVSVSWSGTDSRSPKAPRAAPTRIATCQPTPTRTVASLSSKTLVNSVPYGAKSPFSTRIPSKARIRSGSVPAVQTLAGVGRELGVSLALRRWTVPVYVAGPRTPVRTVRLFASWAPRRSIAVPIPSWARPDESADGHMAILDPAHGCEYNFYQARRSSNDTWTAGWATVLPINGSGLVPGPSARASGFGLRAGLVTPDDLRRGVIDHALVFSYPYTKAYQKVRPATASADGSNRPDALPMGTHLRLDPSLDLNTLELSRTERTVAVALQVYGMYLADTGPNVTLYAVGAQSFATNPYPEFPPTTPYVDLNRIPLDRLQVLEPPR